MDAVADADFPTRHAPCRTRAGAPPVKLAIEVEDCDTFLAITWRCWCGAAETHVVGPDADDDGFHEV